MRGALCAAPSHELFDRVQPWTNLIVDSAVCSISNPDCVLSFIVKNPCCEWCHEQTHGGSKWRVMSPACSLVAAPGYSSVEQGSRLCDRRGCAASVLGARVRANTKQLTTTPVTPLLPLSFITDPTIGASVLRPQFAPSTSAFLTDASPETPEESCRPRPSKRPWLVGERQCAVDANHCCDGKTSTIRDSAQAAFAAAVFTDQISGTLGCCSCFLSRVL
jgi:hypothetical protein